MSENFDIRQYSDAIQELKIEELRFFIIGDQDSKQSTFLPIFLEKCSKTLKTLSFDNCKGVPDLSCIRNNTVI